MKKIMFFALAFVFAFSNLSAQAERSDSKVAEKMKKRVEMLKTELNLSEDQTSKVTELLISLGKQMKEIRENGEGKSEANKEKMKAIMKERQEKMKLILSPEQFEKLKELNKKEFRDRKSRSEGTDNKMAE